MSAAVTSSTAGSVGQAPGSTDSAVALEASLARCKRQLGDWVACSSAKTPEGKKIIAELSGTIASLESRISTASKAAPSSPTGAVPASERASNLAPSRGATAISTLGGLIDLYA